MDNLFSLHYLHDHGTIVVACVILTVLVLATLLFFVLGKIKPALNLSELKARTKSWWIMALAFMAAVLIDTRLSYFFLAFLSFAAFRELYSILGFRDTDRRVIFWAYLAIPVQYYLAYTGWYGAFIIFIPVVMFLLLPFRFVVKGETKGIIKSMASLQWILMLTVFGMSHLAYLLSLHKTGDTGPGGRGLLLYVVFLTEINDVMQFTWGKLLGKHKIIPKVSPNKTWEGFVGGLVCTTAIGFLLRFLTPMGPYQALFVGFMIAFSGFVGDVVMSSIKRDIGIKDTGNVIPGHGGILDRIDSLAYTAPVFFHLIYYMVY